MILSFYCVITDYTFFMSTKTELTGKKVSIRIEHVKSIQTRTGVDVGYQGDNMCSKECDGRVGKAGIDKSFTLERESWNWRTKWR